MRNKTWIKKDNKLVVSIIFNVGEGVLNGSSLGIVFLTIDSIIKGRFELQKILNLSFILGLIFTLRMIMYSIGYTLGHIGGSSTAKDIRIFLGNKIKNLPLKNFFEYKKGELINVITQDVKNYEDILSHKVGDIAKNMALIFISLLFLTSMSTLVGAINIVLALLIAPFLVLSTKLVSKYGARKQEILNDNVSDLVEYIEGIQTFRSYGLGGMKNTHINKSLKSISDISYKFESKVVPAGNLYRIILDFSMPITIMFGVFSFIEGRLTISEYVICVILSYFISQLMGKLYIDLISYKNLMLSKKSMDNLVFQNEESIVSYDFDIKRYDIVFDEVVFGYENTQRVLNKINFNINQGELTAIVGASGSGKSTILNLISKYYEVEKGDIKIGGISIKNIHSKDVLKNISMVYQDVFLFNDSIKNNIRFARENATDDEIVYACKLANCHNFILGLDRGYDTLVGENGSKLSGGQKQRISIARAILKDSPIILLDEATASLDIENELCVKEALLNLLNKDKTVIMIAHNLPLIRNADKILVIENGQVIEEGKHEDLISINGRYLKMWDSEIILN